MANNTKKYQATLAIRRTGTETSGSGYNETVTSNDSMLIDVKLDRDDLSGLINALGAALEIAGATE